MRRFGPAVLVVATVLGAAAGAATGAVLERPEPLVQAVRTVDRPTPSAAPESPPATDPTAQTPEYGAGRATSALGAPVPGAPSVPSAFPTRTPTPLDPDPDPDPDAVDEDGLTAADRAAGLLSDEVPSKASGTLTVVPGTDPAPEPDRDVRAVRVEVEEGLDIDGESFAQTVMEILNDPRGWGGDGSVSFARTDGEAQFRVVLASPTQVDTMCAPLRTAGRVSCGRDGYAALNHTRWVQATEEFDDLTRYRQYLVNHEVGHLLGLPHEECPGDGELAPVMQQQTIAVAPCEANGWPFPDES